VRPLDELEPDTSAVDRALAIVAYAEVRAIMLAWAGAHGWEPTTHAWTALRRVLHDGVPPGSLQLVEQAQALLRDESRAALGPAIRRAGPWPYDRTIAPGQIGSLDGIEATFHEAAKVAAHHRASEPPLLSVTLRLADFAHRYRERPAPG